MSSSSGSSTTAAAKSSLRSRHNTKYFKIKEEELIMENMGIFFALAGSGLLGTDVRYRQRARCRQGRTGGRRALLLRILRSSARC
jgi:hypothetical protein